MLKFFSKDFILYGVGLALSRLVGILVLPLLTNYFSVKEMGLIELGNSLAAFIVLLILLNIDTALTFYYWDSKDDLLQQKEYISSALLFLFLSMGLCFFLFLLLWPILERFYFMQHMGNIYLFILISAVVQAIHTFMLKVLRIQKRTISYNINNLLYFLLLFASLLIFVHYEVSIVLFFVSKTIAFLLVIISIFLFVKKSFSFNFSSFAIKKMLKYSLPLVPFSFSNLLMSISDKVFINQYKGVSEVGVYSIAIKLSSIINLFITAFLMAYGPFVMSIKNEKSARIIYTTIFEVYAFTCLFLIIIIQYSSSVLLKLLVVNSQDYSAALPIFGVLAMGLFVHSLYGQLGIGLNITKKTKYISYGSIIAVVLNIILNMIFVRIYGMTGAAVTSLLSYIVVSIWIYFINNKFYRLDYDGKFLLSISLFFFTSMGAYYWYLCDGRKIILRISIFFFIGLCAMVVPLFFKVRKSWIG